MHSHPPHSPAAPLLCLPVQMALTSLIMRWLDRQPPQPSMDLFPRYSMRHLAIHEAQVPKVPLLPLPNNRQSEIITHPSCPLPTHHRDLVSTSTDMCLHQDQSFRRLRASMQWLPAVLMAISPRAIRPTPPNDSTVIEITGPQHLPVQDVPYLHRLMSQAPIHPI